jgi:hypothetical protein
MTNGLAYHAVASTMTKKFYRLNSRKGLKLPKERFDLIQLKKFGIKLFLFLFHSAAK